MLVKTFRFACISRRLYVSRKRNIVVGLWSFSFQIHGTHSKTLFSRILFVLMGHCGEIHVFYFKLRTNHHFLYSRGFLSGFCLQRKIITTANMQNQIISCGMLIFSVWQTKYCLQKFTGQRNSRNTFAFHNQMRYGAFEKQLCTFHINTFVDFAQLKHFN